MKKSYEALELWWWCLTIVWKILFIDYKVNILTNRKRSTRASNSYYQRGDTDRGASQYSSTIIRILYDHIRVSILIVHLATSLEHESFRVFRPRALTPSSVISRSRHSRVLPKSTLTKRIFSKEFSTYILVLSYYSAISFLVDTEITLSFIL